MLSCGNLSQITRILDPLPYRISAFPDLYCNNGIDRPNAATAVYHQSLTPDFKESVPI